MFLICSFVICCTPKPEPLCCKERANTNDEPTSTTKEKPRRDIYGNRPGWGQSLVSSSQEFEHYTTKPVSIGRRKFPVKNICWYWFYVCFCFVGNYSANSNWYNSGFVVIFKSTSCNAQTENNQQVPIGYRLLSRVVLLHSENIAFHTRVYGVLRVVLGNELWQIWDYAFVRYCMNISQEQNCM